MKIYTLEEFEELKFEHDYKDSVVPLNGRTKTKYKLTKAKTVKPRIVECRLDDNGIPYEHVIQEKVTKQVPNTNRITELIVDFCKTALEDAVANPISSEGRYRSDGRGGGKWIKGKNKGIEDIELIYKGKKVAIELKASKSDRIRESQIKRKEHLEKGKAMYILLRWTTFEDFQELLYKKLGLI
jgi:hypothetical protein